MKRFQKHSHYIYHFSSWNEWRHLIFSIENPTNPGSACNLFSPLIHPRCGKRLRLHLAASRRSCSRLRESFYRAVSEGTRCERRTTSGPERASLLALGGNSIRRPTDLTVARDFHGVTRFPADITFDIYRGVGEGPISHGRLELRPYATGISRVPERERETDRGREGERKRDLREFGGSPGLPSAVKVEISQRGGWFTCARTNGYRTTMQQINRQ